MMVCERCKRRDRIEQGYPFRLVGAQTASHLCLACVRAWDRHYQSLPGCWESVDLQSYGTWMDAQAVAGTPCSAQEYHDYARRLKILRITLLEATLAWLDEGSNAP